MSEATVVVEISSYSEVASGIEEDVEFAVGGVADFGCHSLPAGIILEESPVLCPVPVERLVMCLRIAPGFAPHDEAECLDGETVFSDEGFPLWAAFRFICWDTFGEGFGFDARSLSKTSRKPCEAGWGGFGWFGGGLSVGDACAEGEYGDEACGDVSQSVSFLLSDNDAHHKEGMVCGRSKPKLGGLICQLSA